MNQENHFSSPDVVDRDGAGNFLPMRDRYSSRKERARVWPISPVVIGALVLLASGCGREEQPVGKLLPAHTIPRAPAAEWADIPIDTLVGRLDNEPNFACEVSFEQSTAAASAQAGTHGSGGSSLNITVPSKDVFMNDCLKLPALLQRCLVASYAFKENARCEKARNEFDSRK
jgi:hypothetical protein